ncbi:MAG: tRNA 2-thiouridine(34) synthase MnmA [Holosporales bacterium]|jgi:tRNA-specific 2-thiouridylase|nr:tRNA 2-thiouridine(34) synthase MnmA [Holosporales bacterium]
MSCIAVALSGGVDSSTTAALLKREGHEIFGVTMLLCDSEGAKVAIDYAKRVCNQLDINHHVFDLRKQFKENVIDYFTESYINGLTPNPCAKCNLKIKFGELFNAVTEMGAEILATGHYARIMQDRSGEFGIYKGVDRNKDQSYFLFGVNRNILKSIRFPLGEKCKPEVRRLAAEFGLCTAEKKESQDICFVPGGDYKSVLNCQPNLGDIVDTNGKLVGQHEGLWNYTIGQRKGLKISNQEPLFVVGMDSDNNKLVVGEHNALEYDSFYVSNVNWLADTNCLPEKIEVKTRYAQTPMSAKIILNDDRTVVELISSAFALSPGQCATFYSEEKVLGGGWICGKDNSGG